MVLMLSLTFLVCSVLIYQSKKFAYNSASVLKCAGNYRNYSLLIKDNGNCFYGSRFDFWHVLRCRSGHMKPNCDNNILKYMAVV